jgi:uncharacterized protein YnzC (UPF0291/DUF896 family)
MDNQKISRINELSRIARVRELTPGEQAERAQLRAEYVKSFRDAAIQQLDNTYIQYPDGTKEKLKRNKP